MNAGDINAVHTSRCPGHCRRRRFGSAGAPRRWGAQPVSGQQTPGFYRYKTGEIEVAAIHAGYFLAPTEGLVPGVPLPDVKQALAAVALPQAQVPIPFTSLVLNLGSRLVLLDSGTDDLGRPTKRPLP